jgi:plastocyanin
MAHTSTQRAGAFTWDTGSIPPGARSVIVTMSTPGTYSYSCTVMMHTMQGILVVK